MIATIDSIRLKCSCGKTARLPTRYAGRRVRCTRCQTPLRVPGSGSSVEPRRERSRSDSRSHRPAQEASWKTRLASANRTSSRRPASRTLDPYAPPKAHLAKKSTPAAPTPATARRVLPRDLGAEAHVQALGIWQRISALILFALTGILLLSAQTAVAETLGVALFGLGVFFWWLGSSLIRYQRWARNVLGLFTVLGLIATMVGVLVIPSGVGQASNLVSGAWQLATLWVLFGGRSATVFHKDYPLPDERRVEWWQSPFFFLPIVAGVFNAMVGVALF
ncbi:MAG: hypothetical protein JKY65_04430 [Planctomycetes bacterium]|nr:hypothetical protein [Planctomycetota bacterium]